MARAFVQIFQCGKSSPQQILSIFPSFSVLIILACVFLPLKLPGATLWHAEVEPCHGDIEAAARLSTGHGIS